MRNKIAQQNEFSSLICRAVGVLGRYGGVASFVFAYQGQSMFLEIMKEMRNPAEFDRSVWVRTATSHAEWSEAVLARAVYQPCS